VGEVSFWQIGSRGDLIGPHLPHKAYPLSGAQFSPSLRSALVCDCLPEGGRGRGIR